MYESWFQFSDRPFGAAPKPKHYFPAAGMEAALESTGNCVQRSAGPALVVGDTGTGKTLLSLLLRKRFAEAIPVALLKGTSCRTNRALLQNALYAFGLPYTETDEGQMRLTLTEFLGHRASSGAGCLLIVDEADCLEIPSLEELAGLSNLTGDQGWFLNLVLIGSVRLEESLGMPQLESLNQRLAARNYLTRWTRAETTGYITAELQRVAGVADHVFDAQSLQQIHQVTDGIPRLVNQLCDHTLVLAATAHMTRITAQIVNEAWADLQQLPPRQVAIGGANDPVMALSAEGQAPALSHFAAEIEFGTLDDDVAGTASQAVAAWHQPEEEAADPSLRSGSQRMDGPSAAEPHASVDDISLDEQVERMQEQVEQMNSELAHELEGTEELFSGDIVSSAKGSFEVDATDIFPGPIGWTAEPPDEQETAAAWDAIPEGDAAEPASTSAGAAAQPTSGVDEPCDEPCDETARLPMVERLDAVTAEEEAFPVAGGIAPAAVSRASNPFLEEFAEEEIVYLRSPVLSSAGVCLGQVVLTEEGQSLREMIHAVQGAAWQERERARMASGNGSAGFLDPPWVVAGGERMSDADEQWMPFGAASTSAHGQAQPMTDDAERMASPIVTDAGISRLVAARRAEVPESRERPATPRDYTPPGGSAGPDAVVPRDGRTCAAGRKAGRFSRLFTRLNDR